MKNKKTKKLLKQVKKLVNRKPKVIISLNIQKLVEQLHVTTVGTLSENQEQQLHEMAKLKSAVQRTLLSSIQHDLFKEEVAKVILESCNAKTDTP